MTDEAAFLRAMEGAPDDIALRLVFADWLEGRGDTARSSLLRLKPIQWLTKLAGWMGYQTKKAEMLAIALRLPKEVNALTQQPITVEHLHSFYYFLHEATVVAMVTANRGHGELSWRISAGVGSPDYEDEFLVEQEEAFDELAVLWRWLVDNFGQEWKPDIKTIEAFAAKHQYSSNPESRNFLSNWAQKLSEPKSLKK
jgi:uncharacterized protein (TIGR02996 family)